MPVQLADIESPNGRMAGLAPLGDGSLVYWDDQGELAVVRPQPDGTWRGEARHRAHIAVPRGVLPLGSVRLLSLSRAEWVLWDMQTGDVLRREELNGGPTALLPLGEDAFAVWGQGTTVRIRDARTGAAIGVLSGHTAPLTTVEAASGDLVTTSRDGTLRRWHWASGRCKQCLDLPEGNDIEGSWVGADDLALAWSGSWLWVCDLAAGTVRKVRAGEDAGFGFTSANGLGFRLRGARSIGKGRLLTLSNSEEESIKLWDADSLAAEFCFYLMTGDRAESVFAVTAGTKLDKYWETATGDPLPADAPSLGVWVQGSSAIYRFDVALALGAVRYPRQLHSRAVGIPGRKLGLIQEAMLLSSGRPASCSDRDATLWIAEEADDPRMAIDLLPRTFLTSEAGDVFGMRPLAMTAAGGERCAVAQRARVSIWDLGD